MPDFSNKQCQHYEPGTPPLERQQAQGSLRELQSWQLSDDAKEISCEYKFKNYYQTIAFVNALAWVANQQDHHPDLEVSYNRCRVRFSTHSIGGLSENDFICATRINMLAQ